MNGIRVCIFTLLASICCADKLPLVRGRVESDSSFYGTEFVVELQSQNRTAAESFQSVVTNDGAFEFREVPTGLYQLRLTSTRGAVLAEQLVDLSSFGNQLTIELQKRPAERPVSGTISVRQLQHPVPPKAFRAFADAERDSTSGHELEAVHKLQRALELAPDYVDARCNLGVQYVKLRRYPEALEQFEKAVASGPPSAMLYGNLSYALIAVGRFGDAEQAARRAISLDGSSARAHFLLGDAMAKSVRPSSLEKAPEAAMHLRLGAAELPSAHIAIAQMYLAEGDRQSATAELRLYLKSGDAAQRAIVEGWLKRLSGN